MTRIGLSESLVFLALNPCQSSSFYSLMVLLKCDTIPPKLMVRLHHAHPSNAAPEFVLGRSFSILDLDKTEDALFLCHLTYHVRLDAFDVSF